MCCAATDVCLERVLAKSSSYMGEWLFLLCLVVTDLWPAKSNRASDLAGF